MDILLIVGPAGWPGQAALARPDLPFADYAAPVTPPTRKFAILPMPQKFFASL